MIKGGVAAALYELIDPLTSDIRVPSDFDAVYEMSNSNERLITQLMTLYRARWIPTEAVNGLSARATWSLDDDLPPSPAAFLPNLYGKTPFVRYEIGPKTSPMRIEFFRFGGEDPNRFSYERLMKEANVMMFGRYPLHVASLDDLIAMAASSRAALPLRVADHYEQRITALEELRKRGLGTLTKSFLSQCQVEVRTEPPGLERGPLGLCAS